MSESNRFFIGLVLIVFSVSVIGFAYATHGGVEWGNKVTNVDKWNTTCTDIDADGVCDSWENGDLVVKNSAGSIAYKYTCGLLSKSKDPDYNKSNPSDIGFTWDWVGCPYDDKRDIFVEIDYHQAHYPNRDALVDVQKAFLEKYNIRLHIQVDEQAIYDNSYNSATRFPGSDSSTEWGFHQIKAKHFGTALERSINWVDANNAPLDGWKGKSQVFHYTLFAKRLYGSLSTSGIAEINGNDLMITLGAFTNGVGSRDEQAGTFMHELGHNLNLNHGGNSPKNCIPHYFSVMNYAYQFSTLDGQRPLEYSRAAAHFGSNTGAITLNEGSPSTLPLNYPSYSPKPGVILNEPRKVVYGPTPPSPLPSTGSSMSWSAHTKLNEPPGCPNSGSSYETLNSYSDVANFKLKFTDSRAFGTGQMAPEEYEKHVVRNEQTIYHIYDQRISRAEALEQLIQRLLNENTQVQSTDFEKLTYDAHYSKISYDSSHPATPTNIQLSPIQSTPSNETMIMKPDTTSSVKTLQAEILEKTSEIKNMTRVNDIGGAVIAIDLFRKDYDEKLKATLTDDAYKAYDEYITDVRVAYATTLDYCNPCNPSIIPGDDWLLLAIIIGLALGLAAAIIYIVKLRRDLDAEKQRREKAEKKVPAVVGISSNQNHNTESAEK
jgi:hypothetical protein